MMLDLIQFKTLNFSKKWGIHLDCKDQRHFWEGEQEQSQIKKKAWTYPGSIEERKKNQLSGKKEVIKEK